MPLGVPWDALDSDPIRDLAWSLFQPIGGLSLTSAWHGGNLRRFSLFLLRFKRFKVFVGRRSLPTPDARFGMDWAVKFYLSIFRPNRWLNFANGFWLANVNRSNG